MRNLLIVAVPIGHAILFGAYFLFSGDAAGTAMSVIFAIAMGLMLYILLPTVRDVGPTAPVDPAWAEHERYRCWRPPTTERCGIGRAIRLVRMTAKRAGSTSPASHVLVVDDSPEMRSLIGDVLTEEGFEVLLAASGDRALSLMAERRPDLVITDLLMPGMNGFTLRGEMLHRADLAQVPVVVLSAFWQRPSETLDVVDVIAKPLDLDRLLAVVRLALEGAEAAAVAEVAPRRAFVTSGVTWGTEGAGRAGGALNALSDILVSMPRAIAFRHRLLPWLVTLVAVMALVAPGLVRAEPPQQLTERLTDLAGVFTDGQRSEAEAAIDSVADDVSLWALFVRTTDGVAAPDYAEEVAALNGLGGNDAVLVVAIDDRRYAMWVGPLLDEVSDDEIDIILAEGVEPQLADGEWGTAVAAAAEGLVEALAARPAGARGAGRDARARRRWGRLVPVGRARHPGGDRRRAVDLESLAVGPRGGARRGGT